MATILISYDQTRRRVPKPAIYKIVRRILQNEKAATFRQIHYVFISDKIMRALNRQFMGKRTTTDVLAFDLSEPQDRHAEVEIYINLDQAAKQAGACHLPFTEEALRLVIHGLLHFLGYTDHNEAERKRMLHHGEVYLRRYYGKIS